MGRVIIDVSMSIDGFVAGPDDSDSQPLGENGERLHEWMFRNEQQQAGEAPSVGPPDARIIEELMASIGAVVIGRRTFDLGLRHWGDVPFPAPCFVVTHRPRAELAMSNGSFTFITEGPAVALRRAREAAGDRDVAVMGGDTGRQCLAAGLIDELHIHLVPVLLGRGVRLFEHADADPIGWGIADVTPSPHVTHARYRMPQP
jgi:dihydrofolate reductase